jgi:hypothetical protein
MVRVRRCALVAASASRLVPLSVTENHRSLHPNSTTLRLNRRQSQTTTRTRTRNLYQIEKRRMHLMTWQKQHTRAFIIVSKTAAAAEEAAVRGTQKRGVEGVINEKITQHTASLVSSLDPSSPSPSLSASPLPPGSDSQFRSYRCIRKQSNLQSCVSQPRKGRRTCS